MSAPRKARGGVAFGVRREAPRPVSGAQVAWGALAVALIGFGAAILALHIVARIQG